MSGNLDGAHQMDVPISCLAVSPSSESTLWLGTDAGVWRTTDGGQNWTSFRGTMPVVAALDIEANPQTGIPHGRHLRPGRLEDAALGKIGGGFAFRTKK